MRDRREIGYILADNYCRLNGDEVNMVNAITTDMVPLFRDVGHAHAHVRTHACTQAQPQTCMGR